MKRFILLMLAAASCRTGLPGASLSGRVVITGERDRGGITVTAVGRMAAGAVTDESGAYHIDDLSDGDYTVSASARSTVESSAVVSVTAVGAVEVPDLTLTPAGRLHGRATFGGADKGNGGIFVNAGGALAVTDDHGDYHLDSLPTGSYELRAEAAGYQSASLSGQLIRWDQLSEAPELDLVVLPARGGLTLRGVARLYGRATHEGTQVTLGSTGLTAVTAADGSWQIDGVAEGAYSLALANGAYRETVPQVLALNGGDGMVEDGTLYSLPDSPLTLYQPSRIVSTGASAFTLSADGQRSFYVEPASGKLFTLRVDGSAAPVELSSGPFDYRIVFTADGSHVVYTSGRQLVAVPSDGGTPLVLARGVADFLLSPDSNSIAYLSNDPASGAQTLSVVGIGGGAPLVVDGGWGGWIWSADGKRLLYRNALGQIEPIGTAKLYTVGASAPVTLGAAATTPRLSPDGNHALVLTNYYESTTFNGTLLSVDLTSGAVTTVASGVYDNAQFAGNDRFLYQTVNGTDNGSADLHVGSFNGGPVVDLGTVEGYHLSGDGSTLFVDVCGTQRCGLALQPLGGGAPQKLLDLIYNYAVSADGKDLVYSAGPEPTTWTLLRGGMTVPLSFDIDYYGYVQFSADDSRFVYTSGSDSNGSTVGVASTADGSSVTLAQHAAKWALSPDGTRIALKAPAPDGSALLSLAPFDGSAATVILDELVDFSWSAKNQLVAGRHGSQPPYRFQDGFYVYTP